MRAPTGEEETHPRFDPQERILSTLHAGEIPGLKRYGLEGALDTTHLAASYHEGSSKQIKVSPLPNPSHGSSLYVAPTPCFDAHPNYPSLGFLAPIFDGSFPKLRSLQLRNVPFWSAGMFKDLRQLEFSTGVQTLPLFIPLVPDVLHASPLLVLSIDHCGALSDYRYACNIAPLPNLRRFRIALVRVHFFHFIDVPPFADVQIVRSFCEVSEPGMDALSCLHAGPPWIDLLDEIQDVPIFLNAAIMSVKMKSARGGAITIDVRDVPVGAHGVDEVMPPPYSSLLIDAFGAMTHLPALRSTSSFSVVIPEHTRNVLLYTAVEGFISPKWRGLLQSLENLTSLTVPLPFTLLPIQVLTISSLSFTTLYPRLGKVPITTNIPVEETRGEQLKRITKLAEARHDSDFQLSSLDVDVSVVKPFPEQTRTEYVKTWSTLVENVTFSVRF